MGQQGDTSTKDTDISTESISSSIKEDSEYEEEILQDVDTKAIAAFAKSFQMIPKGNK